MKNLHLFSLNHKKRILENQHFYSFEKSQLKKNNYKVIIICQGQIVFFKNNTFFLDISKVSIFKNIYKKFIFIGKSNKIIYIGLSLSLKKVSNLISSKDYTLVKIRQVTGILKKNIIAYFTSLYCLDQWHNNNKYCSKCSSKNTILDLGHSIICSNKKCNKRIFPRINPTVIMLIYNKDKILLARNANWPDKLYSCLAGFCEISESLEETVKRETYEEVGVEVKNIQYLFSQFWPFPNNLMVGFKAEASSIKLKIDKNEIENAIWIKKSELIKLEKNKEILLPKKHAIAYSLIQTWLKN